MAEVEDALLARSEQFLAGKFRGCVQVAPRGRTIRLDKLGRKGMEMGLVAGRNRERCAVHLEEVTRGEPLADPRHDAIPGQQKGPAVGVAGGVEPR